MANLKHILLEAINVADVTWNTLGTAQIQSYRQNVDELPLHNLSCLEIDYPHILVNDCERDKAVKWIVQEAEFNPIRFYRFINEYTGQCLTVDAEDNDKPKPGDCDGIIDVWQIHSQQSIGEGPKLINISQTEKADGKACLQFDATNPFAKMGVCSQEDSMEDAWFSQAFPIPDQPEPRAGKFWHFDIDYKTNEGKPFEVAFLKLTAELKKFWMHAGMEFRYEFKFKNDHDTFDATLSFDGEGTFKFELLDSEAIVSSQYQQCEQLIGGILCSTNLKIQEGGFVQITIDKKSEPVHGQDDYGIKIETYYGVDSFRFGIPEDHKLSAKGHVGSVDAFNYSSDRPCTEIPEIEMEFNGWMKSTVGGWDDPKAHFVPRKVEGRCEYCIGIEAEPSDKPFWPFHIYGKDGCYIE